MAAYRYHGSQGPKGDELLKLLIVSVKPVINLLSTLDLRIVMRCHALLSIIFGIFTTILPHSIYNSYSSYNHMTHEYLRLYGVLTLSIGWLVWKIQAVKDGRLAKAVSETFCVCYFLQGLVGVRAQMTNPDGHSFFTG